LQKKPTVPDKDNLTTGQVAAYFAVTPDTVRKWVYSGKLTTETTPGGHHRVSRESFQALVNSRRRRLRQATPRNDFQFCWEYHSHSETIHQECFDCIVYRSQARRCFELAKLPALAGHSLLFCANTCEDCDYYNLMCAGRRDLLVVTNRQDLIVALRIQSSEHRFSVRFADREYLCSRMVDLYRPDYILVDESFHEDRGKRLIEDLRKDPRIQGAKIIFVGNAEDMPDQCRKELSAWMSGPVSIDGVAEIIDKLEKNTVP